MDIVGIQLFFALLNKLCSGAVFSQGARRFLRPGSPFQKDNAPVPANISRERLSRELAAKKVI